MGETTTLMTTNPVKVHWRCSASLDSYNASILMVKFSGLDNIFSHSIVRFSWS